MRAENGHAALPRTPGSKSAGPGVGLRRRLVRSQYAPSFQIAAIINAWAEEVNSGRLERAGASKETAASCRGTMHSAKTGAARSRKSSNAVRSRVVACTGERIGSLSGRRVFKAQRVLPRSEERERRRLLLARKRRAHVEKRGFEYHHRFVCGMHHRLSMTGETTSPTNPLQS